LIILFWVSFPFIFGLLYLGDFRTSLVKRDLLIRSAQAIMRENAGFVESLGDYQYNLAYLQKVETTLELFKKQDENFESIGLIREDNIRGKRVFLQLSRLYANNMLPEKASQIYACSKEEREYLRAIFNRRTTKYRFSSDDGHYELYYPVKTKKGIMVFYFNDFQRYGKFGS
jgi:hypothetical protein